MSEDAKIFEFQCGECGNWHRGSPSFTYKRPWHYFDIPEAERDKRIKIDKNRCAIDWESYYIRVNLEIPIKGVKEGFLWGVWISQSEESFQRYVKTYDQDQSGDGSTGWLEVTMPGYAKDGEATAVLGCYAEWGDASRIPMITKLFDTDHPIQRDMKDGITWDRAVELAQLAINEFGH